MQVPIVAVAIAGNTAISAVSSVTIAGVSATQATSAYASDSGSTNTDIWYAAVPTGTTGNIVVTWTVSEVRCVIFVYNNGIRCRVFVGERRQRHCRCEQRLGVARRTIGRRDNWCGKHAYDRTDLYRD